MCVNAINLIAAKAMFMPARAINDHINAEIKVIYADEVTAWTPPASTANRISSVRTNFRDRMIFYDFYEALNNKVATLLHLLYA